VLDWRAASGKRVAAMSLPQCGICLEDGVTELGELDACDHR